MHLCAFEVRETSNLLLISMPQPPLAFAPRATFDSCACVIMVGHTYLPAYTQKKGYDLSIGDITEGYPDVGDNLNMK